MNVKEAFIVTIIFTLLGFSGFFLTFSTFSNQGLRTIFTNAITEDTVITSQLDNCGGGETVDLTTASHPILNKLDEYQDVCRSFVTSKMMIFTETPTTRERAEELAKNLSRELKQFSIAGITPLVVAEPTDGATQISFSEFNTGKYNEVLDRYFQVFKEEGLSDEEMGTWVPFPEANVPYWNHDEALPEDFGENVNIYLTALQTHFPEAEGSILLNSVTYNPEDEEWANGNYESLIPFVVNLDRSKISSIGVQGFPWVSPTNPNQPRVELFTANRFLGVDFAMQMGQYLNVYDIWFNTGTFGERYTDDPARLATVSVAERKTIQNDIVLELARARDQRFRVEVNIFAEDKSNTPEATNWSYIENEEGQSLFRELASSLNSERIPLSLYDITK